MKKQPSKLIIIFTILMVIFSIASLFRIDIGENQLSLASVTLVIGIAAFFITAKENDSKDEGLNFKTIFSSLKDKKTLVLLFMPTVMNIICNIGAELFVPEFMTHLKGRTGFLSFDALVVLVVQLMISALGEEIAWRAFFQKQTSKMIPFIPSLIISSALFSLCHFTPASVAVVVYDLIFIFINAVIYGLIFRRTDNACVSAIAHFLANMLGVVMIMAM